MLNNNFFVHETHEIHENKTIKINKFLFGLVRAFREFRG